MATAAADNGTAVIPADATRQLSYSGTPRGPDGTTTPDDYVRELADPVRRMQVFERMGNDDAVQTGILARRQEVSAANWSLSTEDEASDATEVLEFVEDNVYPIIDDLIRLAAGGAMQYGFAAFEPVYQWSDRPIVSSITRGKLTRPTRTGEQRIYLRKLAHIRQTSVQAFKIAGPNDPSGLLPGDLITLEQHAYDGVTFRQRSVPASKLLIWSYNKQGDDWFGTPPTRACYGPWDFKRQLERLNLLHLDKFAVGVPIAEEGPGWGPAERAALAPVLRDWASGAHNFIIHPNGGSITIESDDGKTTLSMLQWVQFYKLVISKIFLTQQTELGSTETGARAIGDTFYEQLSAISQSDCEELANIINNGLIVPLVRYNFGERDAYPAFTPSQKVKASSKLATDLASLKTAGVLHTRPEDEAWARDAWELPSVDVDTLQKEQDERDAQAAALTTAAGGTPPSDATPVAPKPPVRIAASAHAHHDHRPRFSLASQMADGAPEPAVYGETSWRTPEFSAWEHGIVRPDVLSRDLDLQASRVTSETQDVLRAIDDDLTRQVESLASKGAAALSAGIKSIAVPDRLRKQLRAVLLSAAHRARGYGAQAVMNEIERQLGPSAIGPQRSPVSGYFSRIVEKIRALAAGDERSAEDIKLQATVDQAVEDEIDRREQSARGAASNALHQAAGALASVLASVASTGAKDALIGLSPGRTQDNVSGVVNTGFGIGRSETAQEIASGGGGTNGGGFRDGNGQPVGIVAKVYSAVMDLGTCDECAKWDGAEFPIDYPEDFTGAQAPNPRCAGGYARCRCVWVYVTDKESVPLVPTSKGPLPIRRAA
jgi:hypothetical protein